MSNLPAFKDSTFEAEVIQSEIPVLVDLWAEWCAPCKMIEPAVEKLAEEYAGKVKFGQLNVDENPQVAANYGIRAIPTLLIFADGKVFDSIVGVVPLKRIKDVLDRALG